MPFITLSIFSTYLLFPLIAILLAIVAMIIAKKNKITKNKKFIIYILLSGIAIAIPGLFGFLHYGFMPYGYIGLMLFYLFLGLVNLKLMNHFFPKLVEHKFLVRFGFCLLVMVFGAAMFSLVFNLVNELQYGVWASTCTFTFLLPPLFQQTVNKYLAIPVEVFKIWKYSEASDLSEFEIIDYNKLMVIEIEIFKSVSDTTPTKIKAKTPDSMPFGVWFHKFLHDYNLKFPLTPIELKNEVQSYGWIFYYKKSFLYTRSYVDPDKSIADNQIKEKLIIVAKRVLEDNAYI